MSYLLKLKGRNAKGQCDPIFYLHQDDIAVVIPNLNIIQSLAVKINSIGCMLVETSIKKDNELALHVIEKEDYKPHDNNDFVPLAATFVITKSNYEPSDFNIISIFLDKSISNIKENINYKIACDTAFKTKSFENR